MDTTKVVSDTLAFVTTQMVTDPEKIDYMIIILDYLKSGSYILACLFYLFYYITWYVTHMSNAEREALDDPENLNDEYDVKKIRKLWWMRHDQYIGLGLILIIGFHWGSEILEYFALIWFPILKGLKITLISALLDAIVAWGIMAALERDENVTSIPKKLFGFINAIIKVFKGKSE